MRLQIPESLTQRALRLIRNEAIEGGLDHERRLTEEFFARRFQISKSPIREALNRLEAEGLIKIIPRRGAYVIDLTQRDVEEIYEMREILEARVVRNIRPDRKTLAKLQAAVDAAERYLKKNDRRNYVREDAAFHTLLVRASPNSRLRKALENMQHQLMILRHRTFELSSHTSVRQHRRILNTLKRGDRKAAEKLMVEHIDSVRDRLLRHLEQKEQRDQTAAGTASGAGRSATGLVGSAGRGRVSGTE